MRSWVKALLISAVILATCIFFLPSLAKKGLNSSLPWVMEQADLQNNRFHISHFSWHSLNIEHIQFNAPDQNASVDIQGIEVSFSPWKLLTGEVRNVIINKVRAEIHSNNAAQSTLSQKQYSKERTNNPEIDSELNPFVLTSLDKIFQQLPIQKFVINEFKIIHPQANITTQVELNKQQLLLSSQIESSLLNHPLTHTFKLNENGELSSIILINQSINKTSSPIFNLQGAWSTKDENSINLKVQQSADIQYWLDLISTPEQTQTLSAQVAIQAWNLDLTLPKTIKSTEELFSQLTANGLMNIHINDFNIRNHTDKVTLIENANLAVNLQTNIDQQRSQQWLLTLDKFDLSGDINNIAPIKFNLQQRLNNAISIGCSLLDEKNKCTWKGAISQTINADNLNHSTQLNIEGEFNQDAIQGTDLISRQTLHLETQQENSLWPKAKNKSHGEIILQAQHVEDNWHWQINMPYGFQNQSKYLEKITLAKNDPNTGTSKKNKKNPSQDVQLSEINWQLLPDWQVSGINGEITSTKALSIIIDQLTVAYDNRNFAIDKANFSCNLDWLKLQYSPQLRSQQALSQLPMFCDWELQNKLSNWKQWPIPSLSFAGELTLSSLDFKIAKLETNMHLTGLADNLDLTLLVQHDFNQKQHGSAQLYLNNLKLDWKNLGLNEMQELTQVQLLKGSLSAQGWFQWQQYQTDIFDENSLAWRWQPDVMLRVDDLAGIYQEITTWEDFDIQLALRRPFYEDFRIDSQISALSLHPGIEVTNILARSTTTIKEDLSQALIIIEEVHSNVLGGRINVPLIRFDTSEQINSFGVEFEGIKVEELAALESGSGIKATGQLDGVLPIILLPEGPQVPAGSLYARSPGGIVQYRGQTAESLKESNPSVGLAMQVLSDFRYDTLRTDVTYQPTGELNLGLKFQGYNPTFFDGQETHFNLNLDYNLLDLLESLRISNDIVQKLENKYQ